MMNPCTWYTPEKDNSDLLTGQTCWLWDEVKQKCERNEPCEKPWVVQGEKK